MRDLFMALRDEENDRTHPLLSGVLYAFCPTAAWWSRAGVEPEVPPDAVWHALEALAAGTTLKAVLLEQGIDETLLDDVRQYVRDVDAFRAQRPGIPAPETSSFFIQEYGKLAPANYFAFEIRNDDDQFEGTWAGFYEFVRTFAFLYDDWVADLNMPQTATLASVTLSLSLQTTRTAGTVRWPAWLWRSGPREVITTLADAPPASTAAHGQQDALRLTLFSGADRADGRWKGIPDVWTLDRTGAATPFEPIAAPEQVSVIVERLSALAKEGPYPPLGALMAPRRCHLCGFRSLCWDDDGGLQAEYVVSPENNDTIDDHNPATMDSNRRRQQNGR